MPLPPPGVPGKRIICPPGYVLQKPPLRPPVCVPGPGVAPFGGPASGLWPSGSTPTAGVISPQNCRISTLFAECFTGCSDAAPCGWIETSPPENVVFTGDTMELGNGTGGPDGVAIHEIGIFSPFNLTIQATLTMLPQVGGTGAHQFVSFTDAAGFVQAAFDLIDTGVARVTINQVLYTGSYNYVPGQRIRVHVSVAGGIPTLYLNGQHIPLTPAGPFVVPIVPNIVVAGVEGADPGNFASFDSIFMTLSPSEPGTVFCCPDGTPES